VVCLAKSGYLATVHRPKQCPVAQLASLRPGSRKRQGLTAADPPCRGHGRSPSHEHARWSRCTGPGRAAPASEGRVAVVNRSRGRSSHGHMYQAEGSIGAEAAGIARSVAAQTRGRCTGRWWRGFEWVCLVATRSGERAPQWVERLRTDQQPNITSASKPRSQRAARCRPTVLAWSGWAQLCLWTPVPGDSGSQTGHCRAAFARAPRGLR